MKSSSAQLRNRQAVRQRCVTLASFIINVMLLLHATSSSLNAIPEPVIQDCIVPFLDDNGTRVFCGTNHRHHRIAQSQMKQIMTPIMMRKYGKAVDSIEITVEQFMHACVHDDLNSIIGHKIAGDR